MDILKNAEVECRIKKIGLALHAVGCPLNYREYRGKSYANVLDECSYCGNRISEFYDKTTGKRAKSFKCRVGDKL